MIWPTEFRQKSVSFNGIQSRVKRVVSTRVTCFFCIKHILGNILVWSLITRLIGRIYYQKIQRFILHKNIVVSGKIVSFIERNSRRPICGLMRPRPLLYLFGIMPLYTNALIYSFKLLFLASINIFFSKTFHLVLGSITKFLYVLKIFTMKLLFNFVKQWEVAWIQIRWVCWVIYRFHVFGI
jgi:hypothetical protein